MNDWHILSDNLRITPFSDGHVMIAVFCEPGLAVPVVGDDSSMRNHDFFHEATKRIGASVRHQDKLDASGILSTPSRIGLGSGLALSHRSGSTTESYDERRAPRSTYVHPPRFRRPQCVLPSNRRPDPDSDAPCRRGVCEVFERSSHSAKALLSSGRVHDRQRKQPHLARSVGIPATSEGRANHPAQTSQ